MPAPRPVPRAESVGSLLRPPALRAKFPEVYEGHKTLSPTVLDDEGRRRLEELEELADEAVADAVRRQIDIGLDVITDGEMRRGMFTHSIVDALDGFDDSPVEFAFTNDRGEEMVPPSGPLVGRARLSKVANPALREFEFVQTIAPDYPMKVTFPAPSYWYCEPIDLEQGAYESQDEFVDHMIEIQRELIAEVIDAGISHVQMDWPAYVMAIDPNWRDSLHGFEGQPLDVVMEKLIAVDNAVISQVPDGITTALHVCRGNYRSLWMTEGSLEPIAEQMFDGLRYDRLLIEWEDTSREGDYGALRHLPADGPVVVMGVVSSKDTDVESVDEIERRIGQAAELVDVDQLALSPQCGFASTWEGNELAESSQWGKLENIVEAADRIWGR
jgi:5-methyltetrahydropteroyltriglutamate--homocysteine methyltransferase